MSQISLSGSLTPSYEVLSASVAGRPIKILTADTSGSPSAITLIHDTPVGKKHLVHLEIATDDEQFYLPSTAQSQGVMFVEIQFNGDKWVTKVNRSDDGRGHATLDMLVDNKTTTLGDSRILMTVQTADGGNSALLKPEAQILGYVQDVS